MQVIDKLLSKLDLKVGGCWNWTGYTNTYGYGRFMVNRQETYAHRAAYTEFKGPIPEGFQVMHSCDNRKCCNPAHLSVGTIGDNMRDRTSKNRQARGIYTAGAKLTDEDVANIRNMSGTQKQIAKHYGLAQATVWAILRRKTWKEHSNSKVA